MSVESSPGNPESLLDKRRKHLGALSEPQELFLELKVRNSKAYLARVSEKVAGYCFLDDERGLTELHIENAFLPFSAEIFSSLIDDLKIASIWCQSFDRSLLSLCLENNFKYEVVGYHFRERMAGTDIPLPKKMEVRAADRTDLDIILQNDDSYFESREEAEMVFNDEILLYFHIGGDFIGCGTIMHIFGDSKVYDIGMMVSPPHRKKGYGAAIISYLAGYCKKNGWRPIAGCAVDNTASRKTLEKAGFVTRDRLLLFSVK